MKKPLLEVESLTFPDERFYSDDNWKTWQPSVNHILSVYPKGFGFEQWLKDVGSNAHTIADRAAETGSKVHKITEDLNNGKEVEYDFSYTRQEWEMICKFVEFWKVASPELIANELSMCSAKLKFGGTLDRVLKIGGKNFLIDIKTGNAIHNQHELQQAAYAMMWNEKFPKEKIDQTGILWLKASTRTDKFDLDKMVIQGKGWQVKFFNDYNLAFEDFKHVQAIWKRENPNPKPMNMTYPMTLKL